jgi:hypothetical protein
MITINVLEIKIKAQLAVGKTLDEAHAALTLAKNAQETGDYSELLKAATILEVTVDQKNRRVDPDASTQL